MEHETRQVKQLVKVGPRGEAWNRMKRATDGRCVAISPEVLSAHFDVTRWVTGPVHLLPPVPPPLLTCCYHQVDGQLFYLLIRFPFQTDVRRFWLVTFHLN
jgi:hypothetical protein